MHPAVAALSLEEKGLVLGAALAHTPPAALAARLTGAAGARCATALTALADGGRASRAGAVAALVALVRAPVPAGIERVHPGWLRVRLERESSFVVRAVAAGLPLEVRRVAADVLGARGEDPHIPDEATVADASDLHVSSLQRMVFSGLVPLAGPGAPTTPIARELVALPPAGIVRAIVTAAAAGTTVSPDAALSAGLRALAKLLAGEGDGAVRAVAQRLPIDIGRRLLADAGAVG